MLGLRAKTPGLGVGIQQEPRGHSLQVSVDTGQPLEEPRRIVLFALPARIY